MINTPTTIDLAASNYSIGRMDALTQFHVARRLAPVIAVLGESVAKLADSPETKSQEAWVASVFGPVMDIVAKMGDEESNYIIHACLAVVGRQQEGGKYAPIQRNKLLMFNDIEMPVMFRLVVEVIKENLGGFFVEAAGGLK